MSIHISRWDDFQHYGKREAPWIKNYTRLLSDETYRKLTLQQRGVLHGLWLEYARSHRELPDDTASISRRLGVRVSRATLEALNHAGFIVVSASTMLAPRYHGASTEGEGDKTNNQEQSPTGPRLVPAPRPEQIDGLIPIGDVIDQAGGLPAFLENLGAK